MEVDPKSWYKESRLQAHRQRSGQKQGRKAGASSVLKQRAIGAACVVRDGGNSDCRCSLTRCWPLSAFASADGSAVALAIFVASVKWSAEMLALNTLARHTTTKKLELLLLFSVFTDFSINLYLDFRVSCQLLTNL